MTTRRCTVTARAKDKTVLHGSFFNGIIILSIRPASGIISPTAGIIAASIAATYERSAIHG